MGYVDMAVGTAFFLLFLSLVLMITIQYFVRYAGIMTIGEFRDVALKLFNRFFGTRGVPASWEETGLAPSELGLIESIHVNPILVREVGNISRENEPVIAKVVFDADCKNTSRNNTVRIYGYNMTVVAYEFVNPDWCSGDLLNESYIRFNVNITAGKDKVFFLYYSDEASFPDANFSMTYNTSVWTPASGDSWSDSTTSWSRYGGSSGSPSVNSTIKVRGANSLWINGTFDNQTIGLVYDPAGLITGVNNSWYIDAWIYLENVTNISAINVSVSEDNDTIMTNISASSLEKKKWYHFERKLNDSCWDGWGTFNSSKGIDNISFYMVNNTPGVVGQIALDEVHFELEPLYVEVFPREGRDVVSDKKISALENLTYEDLREIIGEDYRFRIEIS